MAITPYDIGHHWQLFVDDHLIERSVDLRRTARHPKRRKPNPLVIPEFPFEKRYKYHYTWDNGSVILDPRDRRFRAYWSQAQKHTLHAESDDGVHWRKPELGIVEFAGSTRNNIICGDAHCSTVTYNEDHPNHPYLMFSKGSHSLRGSRDGLNWFPLTADSQWGQMSDSGACVYDPFRKRYVAIQKRRYPIGKGIVNPLTADPWDIPIRVLGVVESDDGMNWSEWREILRPDEMDHQSVAERFPGVFVEGFLYPWRMKPEFEDAHALAAKTKFLDRLTVPPQTGYHHMDFMNMILIPYHGLHVGLLQTLSSTAQTFNFGALGKPRPNSPGQDGVMETQLVCSRDLVHWERLCDRKPFLPLGELGAWDQSMLMPFTSNHIVRDGELWLYYGGSFHSHNPHSVWNKPGDYPRETQGFGLATIREHGFVSLEAGPEGGELTTRLLNFDGEQLLVNVDANGGELVVETLDQQGVPLYGREFEQCVPINRNGTRVPVQWRDRPNLPPKSGRPVRFRFRLRNACLFSFVTQ